ncbi:MAG TPA: thioredoxin domain-containing protein [Candidatus Omnitrophota bacterium]|nr:thioredoxin domain-containing protein [Candidatus Omnitrophota bacterium]
MRFILVFFTAVVIVFSGCSGVKPEKKESITSASFTRGPETATLKIEQFSDFLCPYCRKQAEVFSELRKAYPESIRMSFHHFPLSGEPGVGSFPLHEASVCAAEQGKFWEFHDAVFSAEEQPQVDGAASAAGLDGTLLKACMESQRSRSTVLKDFVDAQTRGVSGAPTFFMNGEKVTGMRPFAYFAEKIDPEFAAKVEAERKKRKEDLRQKIDFTEKGRPSQGPEEATVTIVEFSDFHCFFCQKLNPVMDQIMEIYSGKIRRVWRHFPLPIHPQAPYAHVASECAHTQGKFWEFHKAVFSDASKAVSEEDFKRIAGELGLDLPSFVSCYENDATKKKIENDVWLGFFNQVGSTPTLLINGELLVGAKPIEKIQEVIDRLLSQPQDKESAPSA